MVLRHFQLSGIAKCTWMKHDGGIATHCLARAVSNPAQISSLARVVNNLVTGFQGFYCLLTFVSFNHGSCNETGNPSDLDKGRVRIPGTIFNGIGE